MTGDMHRSPPDSIRPSVRRDLMIVAAVTLTTFVVSSLLELNERLIELTRPLEAYQIDELQTTVVAMIVALAWFSWRRSRQSIEQAHLRLAAQRELADALVENRRLSQRYLQVQEDERRFLARELHDELGQSLNAIKVDAVNIRDAVSDSPEACRSAQAIIDVSSRVYDVVRTLLRQLRPVALDELGFASAVQYSVEEWQRRHKAVNCSLFIEGDLDGLIEDINITAYRFVQECLTNVARHAGARNAKVVLRRDGAGGTGSRLSLIVEDDGCGVDSTIPGNGLGLIGLRERVEALGGAFEIRAAMGPRGASPSTTGTHVFAAIPLRADLMRTQA